MNAATEAKAAERWCPYSRVVTVSHGSLVSGNRANQTGPGSLFRGSHCIGSRCMAWRWVRTHINDPAGGADLVPSSNTYGFCGLAGHPRLGDA